MMKHGKIFSAALVMSALLVALPGCEREGPLEKAGRDVDQAVEDMGQPREGPMEQAGEAVDNTTERLGEQVEKAGDNIQDAAN